MLSRVSGRRALLALVVSAGCLCDSPPKPPAPMVLGEAPGIVNAIVVDGEHLYAVGWHATNKGFAVRVPLAGGDVEPLATDEGAPKVAAFHDGRLYWDNGYDIKRVGGSGGTVESILGEGRGDAAMVVDDRHVYFVSSMRTRSGTPQLVRVPVTGGEPEVVVADAVGTHLALSGDWIYWADGDGVSRAHETERRVESLSDAPAEDLWLDGDFVYFCRQFAELHRVPKDGGTDERLDAACSDDMIVVDGVSYWTDTTYGEGATHLSVGVVWRQAPGSARVELYRGDLVSNLVAVGDHVYFGAGTKLLRVPR